MALVATMHGVNGWLLSFAGGNAVSEPATIESAITGVLCRAGELNLRPDSTFGRFQERMKTTRPVHSRI